MEKEEAEKLVFWASEGFAREPQMHEVTAGGGGLRAARMCLLKEGHGIIPIGEGATLIEAMQTVFSPGTGLQFRELKGDYISPEGVSQRAIMIGVTPSMEEILLAIHKKHMEA